MIKKRVYAYYFIPTIQMIYLIIIKKMAANKILVGCTVPLPSILLTPRQPLILFVISFFFSPHHHQTSKMRGRSFIDQSP
jgi:hypothetical protein